MRLLGTMWPGLMLVSAGLTSAAEFRRLDGIHRIEKRDATVTAAPAAPPAALLAGRANGLERREDKVCGTGLFMCPSSLNGGCCSDGYECAAESCFATTRGPSTCHDHVGWYACGIEVGAGCCPDGYVCQTAGNCVPPAGVSYTYGCSAGYYLCPAELNYGCCPNGMGCGVNQCFSTESRTSTTVSVITTTISGDIERITTTITSLLPPRTPSSLPNPTDANYDSELVKYFPQEIAKVEPTASPEDEDGGGGGGGGGLSTGALVGIVIGSVAFLIIVLLTAFIVIRHLNKVVAAVNSKNGSAAGSRPPVVMMDRQMADDEGDDGDETSGYIRRRGYPRGYSKPTDSDIDAFSVDPSITTPRPGEGPGSGGNGPPTMTTDVTATSFGGNYQAVSTSHTNNMPDYFGQAVMANAAIAPTSTETSKDRTDNNNSSSNNSSSNASQPPRQASVTGRSSAAANRVSGDSDGTTFRQASTHARQWSDVSDESNGMTVAPYNPQPATELHGRSIVPELYGSVSPTSELSPLEEARRRSAGSSILGIYGNTTAVSHGGGGGGGVGPPIAGTGTFSSTHQRARNGNGSGGVGRTGEIPGLGIVDEEIHGFYGPSDGVVGATRDDTDAHQGRERW